MVVMHEDSSLDTLFSDSLFDGLKDADFDVRTLNNYLQENFNGLLYDRYLRSLSFRFSSQKREDGIFYVIGQDFYSALLLQGVYCPGVSKSFIVRDENDYYCWANEALYRSSFEKIKELFGFTNVIEALDILYERKQSPLKIDYKQKVAHAIQTL